MELSVKKSRMEDAGEIAALLDLATIHLLQKNVHQWEYPWDISLLEKEIAQGRVYHLLLDGKIAGTFSLRKLEKDPWTDPSPKAPVLYLYRVALFPSCQGHGLGKNLTDAACQIAESKGLALMLDCWAGNAALISFYQSAGFDTIGIFPEENYEICVFSRSFSKENA